MFCPNCGSQLKDGAQFCEHCGAKIAASKAPEPDPVPPTPPTPQPIVIQQAPITQDSLPAQFRPLSPWAYFGYSLLFALPIVGFIMLIVFSCKNTNINRRNFARSYWCGLVLCLIIICAILLIAMLTGGIARLVDWIQTQF